MSCNNLCVCAKSLQSYLALCDPINCSPPGPSVPGILQARILEWVAISFSRGSSQLRNWTRVSCVAGRFFTDWAMREAQPGQRVFADVKFRWVQSGPNPVTDLLIRKGHLDRDTGKNSMWRRRKRRWWCVQLAEDCWQLQKLGETFGTDPPSKP